MRRELKPIRIVVYAGPGEIGEQRVKIAEELARRMGLSGVSELFRRFLDAAARAHGIAAPDREMEALIPRKDG